MSPSDDGEDSLLSEADIAQIEQVVASAPPTQTATPTGLPVVGAVIPTGPDTTADILSALNDMTVPQRLLLRMEPLFKEIDFTLKKMPVGDPYDQRKVRYYTAVTKNAFELALLHLPNWFLQTTDSIGSLKQAIENISNRHGRIISEGLPSTANGIRRALTSISRREVNSWEFVPWNDIEEVFSGQTPIATAFAIPDDVVQDTEHIQAVAQKLQLGQGDIDSIVSIFVREAGLDDKFFKALVQESDWPQPLKTQVSGLLTGNDAANARVLLEALIVKNRYDVNHEHHGETYLGYLLMRRLDSIGNPADETLAQIILKYKLVTDPEALQAVRSKLPGGN